ncbi:MAG: hypothetical protein JNK51_03455 [Blastocatellia bacterium]|nr:hypothetical protein [Chloracidobacterium sp.]MBL8183959.1 hypothetical protein [Blastocatellia bacterium]HRJ89024.1 hypothetical protein [Pyrinomonadaceae bacterium]HRK49978.1 hypothetical protein [Pyrinomonadaceae bacterium]
MSYSPLTISRRHVLGDLYAKCDAIVNVPVYLDNAEGEMLGYVDESHGHYADAFTFHLPEDVCKRLSTGHYEFSFSYEYADLEAGRERDRRIKISYICLTGRVVADPVGPRARRSTAKTPVVLTDTE